MFHLGDHNEPCLEAEECSARHGHQHRGPKDQPELNMIMSRYKARELQWKMVVEDDDDGDDDGDDDDDVDDDDVDDDNGDVDDDDEEEADDNGEDDDVRCCWS